MASDPNPEFCPDTDLAFERSRTHFEAGAGMAMDDAYRLAHLPLVNPVHPRVIAAKSGTPYDMGRHPPIYSLVLPVSADALEQSPAYRELDQALRRSNLASRIAWPLVERRRDRLHATLCSSLSVDAPQPFDEKLKRDLASLGPVNVELRGLFSGNVNRGRLYVCAYPEQRAGANVFHLVQQMLNRPTTDLYVVGIWNLTDDLDEAQAARLKALIDQWWNRPILRFQADRLWLLGASDDLVLDSTIAEVLPLTRRAETEACAPVGPVQVGVETSSI